MENDKGHDDLVADLEDMVLKAKNYDFNDFKSEVYETPKITLIQRLEKLIKNTKEGKYDN